MTLQPIRTAPRDGTYILMFGPSGYGSTPLRCQVGHFVAAYLWPDPRPPWARDDPESQCWRTYANDAFTDSGEPPTHWLPLPVC